MQYEVLCKNNVHRGVLVVSLISGEGLRSKNLLISFLYTGNYKLVICLELLTLFEVWHQKNDSTSVTRLAKLP